MLMIKLPLRIKIKNRPFIYLFIFKLQVRKTKSKVLESAKISDKNEHTKNISPPSIKQKEHKKSSPAAENGESSGCLRSISFGAKTSANNSTSKCDRQPQKLVKEYSLLWVDKYRPAALKNIIGQQGEQSCANKLVRWLKKWHSNHVGGSKPAGESDAVSLLSNVI